MKMEYLILETPEEQALAIQEEICRKLQEANLSESATFCVGDVVYFLQTMKQVESCGRLRPAEAGQWEIAIKISGKYFHISFP